MVCAEDTRLRQAYGAALRAEMESSELAQRCLHDRDQLTVSYEVAELTVETRE
jgi:hypothetical protein